MPNGYGGVIHTRRLLKQVINQTRRPVIDGESVPAREKLMSLRECHTDITAQSSRVFPQTFLSRLQTGTSSVSESGPMQGVSEIVSSDVTRKH
jgi:hypothetical protein